MEALIDLLRGQHIDVLVDIRSQPYSRYAPQFNSAGRWKEALVLRGVRYLFMGRELGGRPEGAEFYDAQGHVVYSGSEAQAPFFLEGIARLETGMQKYRVALMCSEEDPAHCHRHLLVARVLEAQGVPVQHIRGDGSVQAETDLAAEQAARRPA